MIPKGTKYQGGARGGRKISTTYNPGMRPGDSDLTKERQSLIRRFGADRASGAVASTGHTATTGTGVNPASDIWVTIPLTVADNSNEVLNFGTLADIAEIVVFCTIIRNHAAPIRENNFLRISQIGGTVFMGREYDRYNGGDPGVTIVASASGADLILTFTTTDATPDATADIQLIYSIIEEM
jgi:hypothetical protein